ncbi:MAG TPA: nucleoside triphosphate pyrophosphohydrolase [Terriglobales bacterium]|nr:nucleoside triphosphate pyrophosphohydrolase [Terriglobales bacterium]
MSTGEKFERAVKIMARLRAPGGCPWDREQTFDSIKPYTLEETYEVFEAIEKRDWQELPGELGDLLLQVLFYSEMAREAGFFSIDDVLDRLSNKLVERHPHVFGEVKADTAGEVVRNWEALKKAEKAAKRNDPGTDKSLLGGVSRAMPALLEATKLSRKAASVGFDWPEISGIFDKLDEEVAELKQNISDLPHPIKPGGGDAGARTRPIPGELDEKIECELGDLFFVLVNLARFLDVDPESALRRTTQKFRSRFQAMEHEAETQGKALEQMNLDQMEQLWQNSKVTEEVKQ